MKKTGVIVFLAVAMFALWIYSSWSYEINIALRKPMLMLYPESVKQRLWVHHVDTIEKLNETKGLYDGIELDVLFNNTNKLYDVNHPSTPSIGLSLDEYLSQLNQPINVKLWLDYKNLHADNQLSSLQRLTDLCKKYEIDHGRIIIESTSPQLTLSFKENGFFTSYYLPSSILKSLIMQSGESTHYSELEKMIEIHANSQTDAVSTSIEFYHLVKEHFPPSTVFLLWDVGLHAYKPSHMIRTIKTVNSLTNVDVLLTSFSSQYNN